MGSVYPFSDHIGAKTLPNGAAHNLTPDSLYKGVSPPPPPPKEIQYYYFAFAISFMEATGVKNQYVGRTFLSLARFWHTLRGLLSRIK